MTQAEVDTLTAELQEMVDEIHRVHKLRTYLGAAGVAYHVEANHQGTFLALPEGTYCQRDDCKEFAEMVLNADAWLEGQREVLDCPPSDGLWVSPWAAIEVSTLEFPGVAPIPMTYEQSQRIMDLLTEAQG